MASPKVHPKIKTPNTLKPQNKRKLLHTHMNSEGIVFDQVPATAKAGGFFG